MCFYVKICIYIKVRALLMIITLARRTVICQSVAEIYLTGVVPLDAVRHISIINIASNRIITVTKIEVWRLLPLVPQMNFNVALL